MKVIKRFPSLAKGSMPLLMYSLQDAGAVEDSVLGACQILSSRSMIRHMMQVTCYSNAFSCYVYKIEEDVGCSKKCVHLFVNSFTMMFTLDVGVLVVWCGLSQVLTCFLCMQDWNDLVAFLVAILNR